MRRWRLLAMLVGLGAAVLRPAVAQAQPSPPVGPQSRAVCEDHRRAWDEFIRGLASAHDSCLDANKKKTTAGLTADGAFCTDPSCESLHQQRDQARRDANAAVSLCYREVAAFEKKKRDEEMAEKKRKEDAEKRKRDLEAELKRKQEALEKAQREEADRIAKEAADKERQDAADEAAGEQATEAAERAREAEDRRRDADAKRQAEQEERDRQAKAEADRIEEEERSRRRSDEIDEAFDRALEQTKREFEAFERRTRQRAQLIEQTAQQAAALGEQARGRLAERAGAIAQTLDELKRAVSQFSSGGAAAAQQTVGDLMGQYDLAQLQSAAAEGEREPMAQAIHDLLDRTRVAMPHKGVEMEYIRSIFDEAYNGPQRLQPVFDQIANMEAADPRVADEFVDGYTMRVFGPANTARIFADVYAPGTPLAQFATTRDALRRVEAAYEARDPRLLLKPDDDWMERDARMVSWWAEDALGAPQIARDGRGMPIIVGPDGKPVGYDAEADRVRYGFDDIPALLEERGARLLRRGDPVWAKTGVLFAPYARPMETPQAAAQDMRAWLAGEMVGVALQGGHP